MILIEIAAPTAALDDDDREELVSAITAGLLGQADDPDAAAPEATMRRARMMTHLGFRELAHWSTGDGRWDGSTAPPLWLTITVPEEWRPEISRTMIGFVRRAVRRLDRRHAWQRTSGDLWINVVGIADGSIGLDGKPGTADDVVAEMTAEFRASHDAGEVDLPDGVVVDPMCGMQVRLGPRAITLERDGATLGFCAESCRAAYARREGVPLPG